MHLLLISAPSTPSYTPPSLVSPEEPRKSLMAALEPWSRIFWPWAIEDFILLPSSQAHMVVPQGSAQSSDGSLC